MQHCDFDIAIIGLGPAGANFARLIDPRFKVVAFDKKHADPTEQGFMKPCGGLLNPNSQKMLAKLGLLLPKSVLSDPMIFSVRTIDLEQNIERTYLRNYLNVDRHKFDLWLKSLIPSSVAVHNNTLVTDIAYNKAGDFWTVTYTENGESHSVTAHTVVGADGAVSPTRQRLFPGFAPNAYVAKQQWFKSEGIDKGYACFLDNRLTDSYGWLAAKGDEVIVGIALPKHNCKQAFDSFISRVKAVGYNLGEPTKTEGCLVLKPCGANAVKLGTATGGYLLGEAAGFITSNLEGISSALRTSTALAGAFNSAATIDSKSKRRILKCYTSSIRTLRWKLNLKSLKNPFIYTRTLRRLVMNSGITALR